MSRFLVIFWNKGIYNLKKKTKQESALRTKQDNGNVLTVMVGQKLKTKTHNISMHYRKRSITSPLGIYFIKRKSGQ